MNPLAVIVIKFKAHKHAKYHDSIILSLCKERIFNKNIELQIYFSKKQEYTLRRIPTVAGILRLTKKPKTILSSSAQYTRRVCRSIPFYAQSKYSRSENQLFGF